jgi:hypothetical protein
MRTDSWIVHWLSDFRSMDGTLRMAWIKMRTDLSSDPAVIAMAARLGMDDDHVVGKLHKIWSWADTHTRDGFARGVTIKWVDKYVGCRGFAAAMMAVDWLVEMADGVVFPRFEKHNGNTAKARAQGGKRQNAARDRHAPVTNPSRESNAARVTETRQERDQIRLDKRREEKDKEGEAEAAAADSACSPWDKPSRPPPKLAAKPPVNPEANQLLRSWVCVSDAAKWAAHENATPERVRFLCDTATAAMEQGRMDAAVARAFIIAGIRDGRDADPAPTVASGEEQIRAILERRRAS